MGLYFNRRKAFRDAPSLIFNPKQFSGLQNWLQGEAGLTTDLSDNANTVTNNSVTIAAAELNGLDVFRYNGSNARQTMSTLLGKPADFTVVALIKLTGSGRNFIFGSGNSSASSATLWGNATISQNSETAGSLQAFSSDGSGRTKSTTSADEGLTAWTVIAVRYADGDAFNDIFNDGVKQSITNDSTSTENSGTAQQYAVGRMGAFATDTFEGDIAEHVVYDTALTDGNILTLKTELFTKYNL